MEKLLLFISVMNLIVSLFLFRFTNKLLRGEVTLQLVAFKKESVEEKNQEDQCKDEK